MYSLQTIPGYQNSDISTRTSTKEKKAEMMIPIPTAPVPLTDNQNNSDHMYQPRPIDPKVLQGLRDCEESSSTDGYGEGGHGPCAIIPIDLRAPSPEVPKGLECGNPQEREHEDNDPYEGGNLPPGTTNGFSEYNEPPLFLWQTELEEHQRYILYCHTRKCRDFESGHCLYHKPMLCFDYHFDSQKRRPSIAPDGRLRYWDIPCEFITTPNKCPKQHNCQLSHSKDEISYHPAKYKTRMCNGKDCRQAICCFAHCETELRTFAPAMYSQFVIGQGDKIPPQGYPPEFNRMTEIPNNKQLMIPGNEHFDDTKKCVLSYRSLSEVFNFDTFKAILCKNKSHLHDRKLCPFYHNARDKRRVPVTYKSEQCERCFDHDADGEIGICEKEEKCDKCHNRLELLYHPEVFKQRFCATFPKVKNCPRGSFCAFAHTREEITGKLFTLEEEQTKTDDFYMYKFKTLWCPYGVQHDWHRCVYSHTYQDCRRSPIIGYGSEPCPFWDRNLALSNYEKRCPNGFRCQYAHGSKEQLYHPSYYKTMPCTDFIGPGNCPRGELCAFFHSVAEQRNIIGQQKYDYTKPLESAEKLHSFQPAFSRPPLFTLDDEDMKPGRKRNTQSTKDTDGSSENHNHMGNYMTGSMSKYDLMGNSSMNNMSSQNQLLGNDGINMGMNEMHQLNGNMTNGMNMGMNNMANGSMNMGNHVADGNHMNMKPPMNRNMNAMGMNSVPQDNHMCSGNHLHKAPPPMNRNMNNMGMHVVPEDHGMQMNNMSNVNYQPHQMPPRQNMNMSHNSMGPNNMNYMEQAQMNNHGPSPMNNQMNQFQGFVQQPINNQMNNHMHGQLQNNNYGHDHQNYWNNFNNFPNNDFNNFNQNGWQPQQPNMCAPNMHNNILGGNLPSGNNESLQVQEQPKIKQLDPDFLRADDPFMHMPGTPQGSDFELLSPQALSPMMRRDHNRQPMLNDWNSNDPSNFNGPNDDFGCIDYWKESWGNKSGNKNIPNHHFAATPSHSNAPSPSFSTCMPTIPHPHPIPSIPKPSMDEECEFFLDESAEKFVANLTRDDELGGDTFLLPEVKLGHNSNACDGSEMAVWKTKRNQEKPFLEPELLQ